MAWLEDLPREHVLLTGSRSALTRFHHELLADALDAVHGALVVLDAAQCINPHQIWHLNRARRRHPQYGSERIQVQRALTPYQWDAILTEELDADLHAQDAGLVLAARYDDQILRDELLDWQQEQYLDWHLDFTNRLARRHGVPVVWSMDLQRLWRHAPILAARIQAVGNRRHVEAAGRGWRIWNEDGRIVHETPSKQRRLTDYADAQFEAHQILTAPE